MFGDPIYDFARVRMLIWHFNLGEGVLKVYNDILYLTEKEKELEKIILVIKSSGVPCILF